MRLEYYSLPQLTRAIDAIVHRRLGAGTYELFFFGSRVANGGSPRSDIDVGIEAETPLPLSLMRRIREDLEELRTLYTIDFVDFKTVSPEFRRVAKEHIELFATASDVKM